MTNAKATANIAEKRHTRHTRELALEGSEAGAAGAAVGEAVGAAAKAKVKTCTSARVCVFACPCE